MSTQPATLWAPTPWFLTSPPHTPQGTIPRDRLIRHLDKAILDHAVVLVAAPSGYGKTVLLAEWVRRHSRSTAWLTLTRHDRGDETLVLAGILSSIRRFTDQMPETQLSTTQVPDANARTLIGQINEIIAGLGKTINIVIDDAHYAGNTIASGVVDVLTALTEGRLRFVLGGTQELTSGFSRTIAAQNAAMITAADLALTADEILLDSIGTSDAAGKAAAEELWEATGGWPIAVNLRRLAGDLDTPGTSPNALLTDYIAGNVLPRLDAGLTDFILATSVCTRLTPGLAQALSGVDDAESLLEECVAQGLFIHRYVDRDGSRIYRWHDEFAARCSDILTHADAARRRDLDITAAHWLAPHFPAEAVKHAMKADEPELAIEIIRSSWIRTIVEDGARALNVQCLALPAELAAHPEILLIRSCCLNQLDDRVGAGLLTSQGIAADTGEPSFQVTRVFAMLFLADAQPELVSAVEDARRLLEAGDAPATLHAYCLFLLGWSELRLRRDPQLAIRLLESALREAETAYRTVLARRASSNLLFALSYAGNLARALTLINEDSHQLRTAEDWHHYDGGIELFAIGFTYYWLNRIEEAERAFRALIEDGGHDASYTALARVYLAFCGAIDGRPSAIRTAREAITDISKLEQHGVPWPIYRAIASAALFCAAGEADRAIADIEPIRAHTNVPVVRVVAAEIMRRSGRLSDAGQLLSALTGTELSISYVAATAYVTVALIAHERGDVARAHRLLERALDAAAPEHVTQPFSAKDPRLRALLAQHAGTGTAHEGFLAARLAEHDSPKTLSDELGSVLSAREREIYGYLCTTMTATEIGAALFVSVNTIRTHQRAIYRKLGVTNRREAIRLRL